jgi:hypothetical protein
LNVRLALKATELLRRREMSRCAISYAPQQKALLFDHFIGEGEHIGSTYRPSARSMRPMSRYVV